MSNVDIHIEKANATSDVIVVRIEGPLDTVASYAFQEKMDRLMQNGAAKFIVNLERLEYISSAGIRSILAAAKKLKAVQGEIRFCGLKGMVQEVFSISGFATMFPIADTVDAAIARG